MNLHSFQTGVLPGILHRPPRSPGRDFTIITVSRLQRKVSVATACLPENVPVSVPVPQSCKQASQSLKQFHHLSVDPLHRQKSGEKENDPESRLAQELEEDGENAGTLKGILNVLREWNLHGPEVV